MLCWNVFFVFLCMYTCEAQALVEERPKKDAGDYRNFSDSAPMHVQEFYRLNHAQQTVAFVRAKHSAFLPLRRGYFKVWDVVEQLAGIVDESDPDMHLPQCYHSFQTAEALRRDGHPRWLVLVGFIHDLGKILAAYGEPQWAVVGDTFPVGCAYDKALVFQHFFADNPDMAEPHYQTACGIYAPACGFDQLLMSWGHDEYLYQVVKNYIPAEASYIIRFHSFYAAHQAGAYTHLMNDKDREMMPWLQLFSHYDLYSKEAESFDFDALDAYYHQLVEEFFPEAIAW